MASGGGRRLVDPEKNRRMRHAGSRLWRIAAIATAETNSIQTNEDLTLYLLVLPHQIAWTITPTMSAYGEYEEASPSLSKTHAFQWATQVDVPIFGDHRMMQFANFQLPLHLIPFSHMPFNSLSHLAQDLVLITREVMLAVAVETVAVDSPPAARTAPTTAPARRTMSRPSYPLPFGWS